MPAPANGWTAGQFALFRALLGVALALPGWGDPVLRAVVWLPALALAIGRIRRVRLDDAAAVVLVALFLWRLPLEQAAAPGWLLVWILLVRRAHLPGMPPLPRLASVVALIAFGAWLALGTASLQPIWILLPLAAADPAWIPPRRPHAAQDHPHHDGEARAPILFFDGTCGFCHRSVRFVLAEDVRGRLRFAPLQGDTYEQRVPPETRAELPDSLVLLDEGGALHVRSRALLETGARLGGIWRPLAAVARLVPASWRDAAYDAVARVRKRLFPAPEGLCPTVAPEIGARFLP